jgi:YVTN family beta-propeller protein
MKLDWPESLNWSSVEDRLYTANYNSDNVTVIDCATNTVAATIPVNMILWPERKAPEGTRFAATPPRPHGPAIRQRMRP